MEKARSARVPGSPNRVRRPQRAGLPVRKGREDGGDLLAGSAGFLPGEDFAKSPARGRSWRARGRFRGAGGSATGGFGELALPWQGRSPHEATSCHFHQRLRKAHEPSSPQVPVGQQSGVRVSIVTFFFFLSSFFLSPPPRGQLCQKVFRVSSSAAPPWLYSQADMHYITRKSLKNT